MQLYNKYIRCYKYRRYKCCRNIGMGISSMSARIGGMLAPQILDLGAVWGPLPLLLFGVLSAVAGSLALLLPETNGRPLPQTIEDVTHPEKL